MRPAQKAPENLRTERYGVRPMRCFNEAGAKSAGKPGIAFVPDRFIAGFNEAGAKSAGKRRTLGETRAA